MGAAAGSRSARAGRRADHSSSRNSAPPITPTPMRKTVNSAVARVDRRFGVHVAQQPQAGRHLAGGHRRAVGQRLAAAAGSAAPDRLAQQRRLAAGPAPTSAGLPSLSTTASPVRSAIWPSTWDSNGWVSSNTGVCAGLGISTGTATTAWARPSAATSALATQRLARTRAIRTSAGKLTSLPPAMKVTWPPAAARYVLAKDSRKGCHQDSVENRSRSVSRLTLPPRAATSRGLVPAFWARSSSVARWPDTSSRSCLARAVLSPADSLAARSPSATWTMLMAPTVAPRTTSASRPRTNGRENRFTGYDPGCDPAPHRRRCWSGTRSECVSTCPSGECLPWAPLLVCSSDLYQRP